jgi:hypothetical protein
VQLVDANVLLYAVNEDAEHHHTSRAWLDGALSGDTTVAFAWIALLAFVRLATRVDLFESPLVVDAATNQVDDWLAAAPAIVVDPTTDHARILWSLLRSVGTGGNLVNDAHLAALALEHRCTIVSFDNDFDRFAGVRWELPNPRRS